MEGIDRPPTRAYIIAPQANLHPIPLYRRPDSDMLLSAVVLLLVLE